MRRRTTKTICVVALTCCLAAPGFGAESVMRGRNESPSALPASNVIGSGNITLFADVSTGYGLDGIRLDPALGGTIGVGNLLQLTAQGVPYSLQRSGLGTLEAHLQATIPGNDRLRFFGVAARADLYLSTMLDTISKSTEAEKPDYNPYVFPSLIVDFDFLSKWKRLPLKAYLLGGMVDNPQLLFRYNQISVRYGLEWKMFQHALFVDGGAGWYREHANRLNGQRADAGYEQLCAWIEPGGRYRFLNRFSIVGGIRCIIYQSVKDAHPLYPEVVGLSLRLEAPLMFLETNTEAIRSLVFMEQEKERRGKRVKTAASPGQKGMAYGLDLGMDSLATAGESFDYRAETQNLAKERQEIQRKMEEIERLFEGIDETEGTPNDSTQLP